MKIRIVLVLALLAGLVATAAPSSAQDEGNGAKQVGATPASVALEYLRSGAGNEIVSRNDVADLVVSDIVPAGGDTTVVYVQQRQNGLAIAGALSTVVIDADLEVVDAVGRFRPGLAAVNEFNAEPTLGAGDATDAASRSIGQSEEEQQRSAASGPDIEPELVVTEDDSGALRTAWQVTVNDVDHGDLWQVFIDANTGEEIDRVNLVAHSGTHDVYDAPVEAPSFGSRTTVVNPADPVASPFGWNDTNGVAGAESTLTQGNNVISYLDTNADNLPDAGSMVDGGAGLVYQPPLNLALPPASNQDADVASMFYWNNLIHDIFYAYGFDEASGNFQTNNYGRGGLGNDAVLAESQDGSATNNANFATPPDGFAPRMQMFVFTAANPDRSSALDNGIVIHEYGHGISNRLTGGPSNVTCLQNAEQAGEGWSDYFSLMLTMEPGDAGTDSRGIGTWALGQATNGPGIRTHPYSTNMLIDPRTYDEIKTASVPHGVGSTFAAMLWEMTWGLIAEHGFSADLVNGTAGNNIALQLVVDGLKLQPCSPGFVDARDAILLADQNNNAGANECIIWEAFAKRGLGFSASQGSSISRSDGIEAFDLPPQCQDLYVEVLTSPASVIPGDVVTFTVNVTNNSGGPLTDVKTTSVAPTGLLLNGGAVTPTCPFVLTITLELQFGALADGATESCSFDLQVMPGFGSSITFSDDFEAGTANWSMTHGVGPHDWVVNGANPRSGATAMFAIDPPEPSDQYLATAVPYPIGSNTVLEFWHDYNTELGWDGGVVETSPDGVTWTDAGVFFENGYVGALSNAVSNPIGGREAFHGDSFGYVRSRVDLSGLAGSSQYIRFRLGSDAIIGDEGWYVDDVTLLEEVAYTLDMAATSFEGPASFDEARGIVDPNPVGKTCAGLVATVDLSFGDAPTVGNDIVVGTPANDFITDPGESDIICGNGGDDVIEAGPGHDIVYGGPGADWIHGDVGNDQLFGEAGTDTVIGGAEHDYLDGGSENDYVDGGLGDDQLLGQGGADTLEGGAGFDQLFGHGGPDLLYGESPGAATGDADYLWGGPGVDYFEGNGGDDWFEGNDAGENAGETMVGGPGNDIMLGWGGADTLHGDGGLDYLWGGDGVDTLHGGADRDTLDGNDADDSGDTMNGDGGDDIIVGWGGADTLNGGDDSDYLWGGAGIDSFNGGGGADYLDGNDGGEDAGETMNGDGGADQVIGWGGNDVLNGGSEDDYLWGGDGVDDLHGDAGAADVCIDPQNGVFGQTCETTGTV